MRSRVGRSIITAVLNTQVRNLRLCKLTMQFSKLEARESHEAQRSEE